MQSFATTRPSHEGRKRLGSVADGEGNILKEGSSDYTFLPAPASVPAGTSPMYMDDIWMVWA